MAIIQSCCCWHSLRMGCYASAVYTTIYFTITIATLSHFIDVEQRYLSGSMEDPESESFLEPNKITHVTMGDFSDVEKLTPSGSAEDLESENSLEQNKITHITVSLNIALLACSSLGLLSCLFMVIGVYKDIKFMLLPWVVVMCLESLVEILNLVYLFYLQTMDFNPITSFLFTLDFFMTILNIYAMVCVISQFQEYVDGRGTAAFDFSDRLATVQYTATAQNTITTSSAPSGRRRSTQKPTPSRCDLDEFSEAPSKAISSVLSKPSRPGTKKHVQFPDEQSCIEEASEVPAQAPEKADGRMISSLWMEVESSAPAPTPER